MAKDWKESWGDVFPTNVTRVELPLALDDEGFNEPIVQLEDESADNEWAARTEVGSIKYTTDGKTILVAWGKHPNGAILFRQLLEGGSKALLFQVNAKSPKGGYWSLNRYRWLAEETARNLFSKASQQFEEAEKEDHLFIGLRQKYWRTRKIYWSVGGRDWRKTPGWKNLLKKGQLTYEMWLDHVENEECPICGNRIGKYGPGYDEMCGNGDCPSYEFVGHPSRTH